MARAVRLDEAPPLDERIVDLRVNITGMVASGNYSAAKIRQVCLEWGRTIAVPPLDPEIIEWELERQLVRLQPASVPAVPESMPPAAPLEAHTARAQLEVDDEPLPARKPLSERPTQRLLDLARLHGIAPPPFEWWVPGWLSPHPTLLSGRGGVGKSLLALQLAVGCAAGRPLIGKAARPLRVLYWACEDDDAELHRRLAAITVAAGIGIADLAGMLHIDARLGLENTLLTTEYGRPMWTPTVELLRQQLADMAIDVLILDNLAHVFGASENDRSAVTLFTAGLCGLILDRPWCPMLIGHVAKTQGSEYAGSTAWENAVRMRWYLGRTLPDAKDDEEAPEDDVRVLAKRKSNYSADDVLKLRVADRHFAVEQETRDEGTVIGSIREGNARRAVLSGLQWLKEHNIDASDQYSVAYLPALLLRYEQSQGHTKRELDRAMRQLIGAGNIVRGVVGKKSNRMPKMGLIVAE